MTNTRPVPNLNARVVDKAGFLLAPWNYFFQQFVQQAPKIQDVTSSGSPYKANQNGTVILTGATTVSLTRGLITISLTGQRIIPISIGDTISWTGPATVQFLGA